MLTELANPEEAELFLRGVGLTVKEDVVQTVLDTLRGLTGKSLYDLYSSEKSRDGNVRVSIISKNTAYKIRNLFRDGKLEHYVEYMGEKNNYEGKEQGASDSQTESSKSESEKRKSPENASNDEPRQFRNVDLKHFGDFPPVLKKLPKQLKMPSLRPTQIYLGGFTHNFSDSKLCVKDRILLDAFRNGHSSGSMLWDWVEEWQFQRSAFNDRAKYLENWIRRETSKFIHKVDINELFYLFLLQHGFLSACDIYETPLRSMTSEDKQSFLLDDYELASGENSETARVNFLRLWKRLESHPDKKRLGFLHRRMQLLKDQIIKEVEIMMLKRTYSGRCNLCPL